VARRRKAKDYPRILCVPDTQCRPNAPVSHLRAVGRYALEKRPQTIVHLGDAGDFPSLSGYDAPAAKGFDQRDFTDDAEAAMQGAMLLLDPIRAWNKKHRKSQQYHPRTVLLEGNHDGQTGGGRLARAAREQPWLRRALLEAVDYSSLGWEVIPFLLPVFIHGIAFAHFFCRNANGQVLQSRRGMPSAKAQVIREGVSAIAGHLKGLQTHIQTAGDGTRRRGIIAGSYYQHDEEFHSPQGHAYWRGLLMLNEVREGDFDLCEVSLGYMMRKWA